MTERDRFWNHVYKEPGEKACWLWEGAQYSNGYGMFRVSISKKKRRFLSHRYAYELLVGPIPIGLEIDHLCRVTSCVRPDHLEPVTHRENVRRGYSWAGINSKKTECPQGHPYTAKTTY